ncbi:MAG: chalcone isomerase family protein [Aeromonas sp.]
MIAPPMMAVTPAASAAPWQQLRPVGQGEMNWLWFKLYDATLYSKSGRYVAGEYPLALTLTYARSIAKDDLLRATDEELARIGGSSLAQRARWRAALSAFWPDVTPGDRLTFYVDSRGAGHFWWHNRPLGSLNDPQFCAAFLGIWLADNSRDPALTRRLRGQL